MAEGAELAEFERKALAGYYANGCVLICERIDRISRLDAHQVFSWLLRVTKVGVVVATADDGEIYSRDNFTLERIIKTSLKITLAHEESLNKSRKVASAWRIKYERLDAALAARARGEQVTLPLVTSRIPGWLYVDSKDGQIKANEQRADLVRWMFEETRDGAGLEALVRKLNQRIAEGTAEVFGKNKKQSDGWHKGTVQRILTETAVLGELVLKNGKVIKGYYPQVVPTNLWEQVQAARDGRGVKGKMAGRKGSISNILSGLTRCQACDGSMNYRPGVKVGAIRRGKGKQWINRKDGSYLICDKAQRGRGCDHKSKFIYVDLEASLLDAILALALDDTHFARPDSAAKLEIQAANLRRDIQAKTEQRDTAMAEHLNSRRQFWLDAANKLDAEIEADTDLLATVEAELIKASGAVSPEEHIARVMEVREAATSDDPEIRLTARRKIHQALHQIDTNARFQTFEGNQFVDVALVNGARTLTIKNGVLINENDSGSASRGLSGSSHRPGEANQGWSALCRHARRLESSSRDAWTVSRSA